MELDAFIHEIKNANKVQTANSMSIQKQPFLLDSGKPEDDITNFMISKGYLPNDTALPHLPKMKSTKVNSSYILSKLSDEELLRLLNVGQSKNVYDINDIIKIALEGKTDKNNKVISPNRLKQEHNENLEKFTDIDVRNIRLPGISPSQTAFHRLNHKEIYPQTQKNEANFLALKKLQNLIHSRIRPFADEEKLNDEKKELLFDILVAQLKALCCKSTIKKSLKNNFNFDISHGKIPIKSLSKQKLDTTEIRNNEFMFLILNEEIKTKDYDDLVLVDPDTLERNSSVLILGPVTSPLTDDQLKIVMNRISSELSKPEYLPLLQQLSERTLNDSKISVMKNFIYGTETRRYIKAHRCNHRSKLAKIYGGPKWLICTGYLNINTPSLYD